MKDMHRTIRFGNKNLKAVRLYSSGLGEQFTVLEKQPDGKESTLFLSEEIVRKQPEHELLFVACKKAFGFPTVMNGPKNWAEDIGANASTVPGPDRKRT